MKDRAPQPVSIEIAVESPLWQAHPGMNAALRRAIRAAAAAVTLTGVEVSLVLTCDTRIRDLNRRWRGQDKPTNVLSFPVSSCQAGMLTPRLLGDVVIAYETTQREAGAQRKPLAHHVAHLAVHGFLHLIGYDHAGAEAAQAMERIETLILAGLQVPDPYAERDPTADH